MAYILRDYNYKKECFHIRIRDMVKVSLYNIKDGRFGFRYWKLYDKRCGSVF